MPGATIEPVTIEWEGGKVSGRFVGAASPVGVLLAHGAGLGQDHEWMVYVRDGLAGAGFPVLTFNYPYMEAGRKAPDRPEKLLACHQAAAQALNGRVERVVLAGKSMGGRMGSHVLAQNLAQSLADEADEDVAGLVFYGYPLVGIGQKEPRDVSHLADLGVPMLFVQGTRDRMAPLDILAPVVASLPDATLYKVEDGDHSFRVPKRSGRDVWEVLDGVVAATVEWIS